MPAQGNFGRVFINGWELTGDSKDITVTLGYKANLVLPQNIGIKQYNPGPQESQAAINGYKRTGQGVLSAHNLLSYGGIGSSYDLPMNIVEAFGNNASPAAGDIAAILRMTLLDYTRSQKWDEVQSFQAKFDPRGARGAFGNLIHIQ